jgi:hypothetical protein
MGTAWALFFAARYEDAIREAQDVLTLRPGLEEAGNVLISANEMLGHIEEAALLIRRQRCWGLSYDADALLAAYRRGGLEAYWRERRVQMESQLHGAPAIVNYSYATVNVLIGDYDAAVDHLEQMIEHRAGGSVFIGVNPILVRMRGTPRYDAVVRAVGAPLTQMA